MTKNKTRGQGIGSVLRQASGLRLIDIIEYPASAPPQIRARCGICRWKSASLPSYHDAQHAAVQHLWSKRHAPGHTRADRLKACPRPEKKAHLSELEAVNHIKSLYRQGRGNPDYQPYFCQCGMWHIGHSASHFQNRIRTSLRGPVKRKRRHR